MSDHPTIQTDAARRALDRSSEEEEILRAVRGLDFGVVEVVVHERRITEIRETRRTRFQQARTHGS